MAYICLYQEASHPDEMREMKAYLAKLFVAILPFIRRQPAYKDHISGFWSNLPFPWREDMRAFYDEGLLNEYAQIFDTKGNWIEEEHGEEQTEPQNLSAPGPSSGAPPFYGASVDEMTRRMRDANVRDF
ncbi:uncharacterized protein CTRU02_205295 [Colletotrichum truncatum]|uniref:Uncharacterized protein n=1 Tax=Colletotrichum truncatum TaxID=5467 RepID=A0ACC3Z3X6_COLTU|nr:uncharacterized protein CTRU02_04351 [Colletotrichum truncatum]KAF6795541.1 hypothetical protein CTRU02_04351 [Colletotrichum truncatum]